MNSNKVHTFGVRMQPERLERFEKIARRLGMKPSELARQTLDIWGVLDSRGLIELLRAVRERDLNTSLGDVLSDAAGDYLLRLAASATDRSRVRWESLAISKSLLGKPLDEAEALFVKGFSSRQRVEISASMTFDALRRAGEIPAETPDCVDHLAVLRLWLDWKQSTLTEATYLAGVAELSAHPFGTLEADTDDD